MNGRNILMILIEIISCSYILGQSSLSYSSFENFKKNIIKDKRNIIVLNFWATWCKPCVAELPDFERIKKDFKKNKVEVILANLDFHSQADSVVPAFIKKNNIQSKVIHITDQDPNDWINKVDPSWTGALPATVIYYKQEKLWFFEGQTDYETLESILTKYIKK